ncbi:MAG: ATP-binding cassette domain-containing protein [Acaryochloridaceae cyanobacterium SU_2_1]|nr:ATP-binding cassette domain-containing protein [Acaryochloridaceae cyanobacterium SU_2_1]
MQLHQVAVVAGLGNQYLLQDISFAVFAGDRIGLIGASGSGKTTLLRLLNRLSDPSTGQITYQNQSLATWPISPLRQQIMLVPQEPKLLGMTVEENLCYPLILQKLNPEIIQARVALWRARIGIDDNWLPLTELQLSLGQRQLVCLARACVCEPKIVLLDEPTSALDPGTIQRVAEVLQAHSATLIIASHQFGFLQQVLDQHQPRHRILYLEQGRLLQDQPITTINWQDIQQKLVQQALGEQEQWH